MKKLILNNKSYLSYDEVSKYKKDLENLDVKEYEIILFPSIHYLSMFKDYKYNVGTQNFYSEKYGNYTGEVSLESLKDLGISYTLLNHFERIVNLLDNKKSIKEKLNISLKNKFETILLVGENKYAKDPFKYVKKELDYYLKDIKDVSKLSILYEPSWLMESLPEINCIRKMVIDIKEYFINNYKTEIEVYYAGGVDVQNVKSILEFCDGVGLGKSGTNIKKIEKIIA